MRTRTQPDARLTVLGLTALEMVALDGASTVLDVASGTVLCHEGSSGHQMAWILAGTADVRRGGKTVAAVGPGDVVGEGTMLGVVPACSADVVATSAMTIAVLSQRDWQLAKFKAPALSVKLEEVAADRCGQLVAV